MTTRLRSLARFRTHNHVITEETKQELVESPLKVKGSEVAPADAPAHGSDWRLILFAAAYLALDYIARVLPTSHGVSYPFGAMFGSALSVLVFLYAISNPAGIRPHIGFTWKQRPGSVPFSIAAAGVISVIHVIFGRGGKANGFWSILQSVIIAPVTEELAFRGAAFALLFRACGARSGVWPTLITSLCFALPHTFIHKAGQTAFAGERFGHVLIMGLILGAVRARSGSLLFPVLCHVIWNGVLVMVSCF